ncbi:MAG: DoxX family protein [Candidatus Promineifilaceae bacterium]
MNIALWVVQGLLGLTFLMVGGMKLMKSREEIAQQMAWANDFSDGQVKTIGALELLGAIGVVLPGLVNILPILTPLAAVGLALIMLGAARTHLRRGENQMIVVNGVLFLLAVFVVYGRFVAAPF